MLDSEDEADRKNYLVFESSDEFEKFLKRKISPTVENGVEYCTLERYPANRILFTAEHAQTKKLMMRELGPKAYVGIGDTNTDILAKLGAYYLRSAYIVPLFIRTEADASRSPEDLGKGLRLFVKPLYAKQKTTYVPIHTNASMLPQLMKYHQTIEKLDPSAIISVHGISVKRENDLIFGFGEDFKCIGGKKEAFKFKDEFTNHLDSVFNKQGVRESLKIKVSTWGFTGSQNYVLTKHVVEHNKSVRDPKNKRIGIQLELNWRGRAAENDYGIPTTSYQLLIQALGDFMFRWKTDMAK